MPATKFIRVATEGATADGRTIARSDIEQMGRNYSPKTYGARIWLEHIRGITADSQFKALGDVLETKAEEVDTPLGKKLALFVKLDVTEELVGFNKKRQKIYTSIEITPNFAKTGEAYLSGLAVTDSPASLGTEALKLFSSRKQDAENLFTEAIETVIEIEEESQTANIGTILLNKVKELLGSKNQADTQNFTGISQAVEAIAESQKTNLDQFSAQAKQVDTLETSVNKTAQDLTNLSKDFADLTAKLANEPAGGGTRPAATGGNGTVNTDC